MIFGKKYSLMKSNSSYNWDYNYYILQLESNKNAAFSLSPSVTECNIHTFTSDIYHNAFSIKHLNKDKIAIINKSTLYSIYDVQTQTCEYVNTTFSINSNNRIFLLSDRRIIICSGTNIYIADDIFCTNLRLLASVTSLSTSTHGIAWCIDYGSRYVFIWYNETTKIGRVDITTGNVEYFTLSGITWLYKTLVLPDDSLLCATIGQLIHRFSGTNYATHISSTHGSYAGYESPSHIIADECCTFIGGSRSGKYNYFNIYTCAPTSTLSYGNSDYMRGYRCLLPCGQWCFVACSNASAGIAVGLYVENAITGQLNSVTATGFDMSSLGSGQALVLLSGKVMCMNTTSNTSLILDFGFSKLMDNNALTSPWFINRC